MPRRGCYMFETQTRKTTKPAIPTPACVASMNSPFLRPVDWARRGAVKPEKIASANRPAAALGSEFGRHHATRSAVNEKRQLLHAAYAHQNVSAKQKALGTNAPQIENAQVDAQQNSSCHQEQ